jgi:hypothetical protein
MTGSTTNSAFSEYIYFDGKRAARRVAHLPLPSAFDCLFRVAGGAPFRYLPPLPIFFGCRTLRFLKGADFDSPPLLLLFGADP